MRADEVNVPEPGSLGRFDRVLDEIARKRQLEGKAVRGPRGCVRWRPAI